MSATLVCGFLLGMIGAALYLTVAFFISARTWRTKSWPLFGLALFWAGVGAYALADALMIALWLAGVAAFPIGVAALHWDVITICLAFGGLVGYLAYVHSVSRRIVVVVAMWYAVLAAGYETWYAVRAHRGITAGVWGTSIQYANEGPQLAWWTLLIALFLPAIIASLLYARLARLASSPTMRRRIMVTSTALTLFFLPSLLAWLHGHWYWWGLAEKLVGIAAGSAMLAVAYSAWTARLLPDEAILDQVRALRRKAHAELATRVGNLV